MDPKLAFARYDLGLALAASARTDDVVHQFQQTLRIAPKFAPAYGGLGEACLNQRRYAAAAIRKYLELLPPGDPQRSAQAELLRQCEQLQAQGGTSSTATEAAAVVTPPSDRPLSNASR